VDARPPVDDDSARADRAITKLRTPGDAAVSAACQIGVSPL